MPKKVNKMEHKVSRALQLNSISVLFLLPTKLETIFILLQIVQEEETTIYISCIEGIQSNWATYFTDFSKAASHSHCISIYMIKNVCQNKKLARGVFL